MSYDFEQEPPAMSSTAKTVIGCGVAAFLCVALICGGLIFLGFRFVDFAQEAAKGVIAEIEKQVDTFATKFEAQGYKRVTGQVVKITSDVKEPTVYTVQVFELDADSEASLAVMAQAAEIKGTIDGDLTFFGQALTIHEGAVITGNLNIEMAQVVDNRGTVQGEVIRSEESAEAVPFPEGVDLPIPEVKPPPGDVIDKGGAEREAAPADTPSPADAPADTPADAAPTTEQPVADPPRDAAEEPRGTESPGQQP